MDDTLRIAVEKGMSRTRELLERHVRIPSISADPMHDDDVEESAMFTRNQLSEVGFPTTDILRLEGAHPAVFGSWEAHAGAPTVLLYAHHDVQPIGPADAWTSDPFEPTERSGRLYGRGSADDKAGLAMHLGAMSALADHLPVGVKVLVEGEEEIGSIHLTEFLDRHIEELRADVIIIGDSGNWREGEPALTTSLRGLVDCTVTVRVLEAEVHSGMFGGAVPDALTVLSRLIATFHNPDGSVAVEGLIESQAEDLDLTESELRVQAGMIAGVDFIGKGSLTSRLWRQPAIAVLAINAPRLDTAVNALVASASAKISLRIAPGQDPDVALDILESHIRNNTPWGADVAITRGSVGKPFELTTSGAAATAMAAAMQDSFGTPAVHMGAGGSIPFVAAFASRYPEAEILLTGVADPTSSIHGPNESVSLDDLHKSVLTEARALKSLGRAHEERN
ncbi:MAG: dipeptidase [Acidimicrobiia bacterium]|nr:dipeptidase [Acidimicrobiia bacterium]NND13150.1 dipeptidase [Acidimicrobiia bacterium]